MRRLLALLILVAVPLEASHEEVLRADWSFDLVAARDHALATVAEDSRSAEAIAVAGWWLDRLSLLPEPDAIVAAAGPEPDPEVAALLARVESELGMAPPAGTLPEAELAGPFGAYSTLDLERGVVPDDERLPPVGTPWRGPAEPARLELRGAGGWIGPSPAMASEGVYLAAWTLSVDERTRGWLLLECEGSFNLELDGNEVGRGRDCGLVGPVSHWYSVDLPPGDHRLRVEMGGQGLPKVRVSLLAESGAPLPLATPGRPAAAAALARPHQPPAAAELDRRLDRDEVSIETLLLAAAVAESRGHPRQAGALLARAERQSPDDPRVQLERARYFLTAPTGADPEVDFRRAQEHLRNATAIPFHLLLELDLAARQRRVEDREAALDRLVTDQGHDVRVLLEWVREAVRRGWDGEADEGLEQLDLLIPGSPLVADLRLDVLDDLERWEERNRLLLALADGDSLRPPTVEQLAASCQTAAAVAAAERLRAVADDPGVDVTLARLVLESGDAAGARRRIEDARARWGSIPPLDQVALGLAASDSAELERVLAEALARDPSDLEAAAFAWRRGAEPFFAPYRVDALAVLAELPAPDEGVDAVLLLDQAVERVYPDGSSLYYYHGLTKALTPAGARQASQIQQMEGASLLELKVIKPDGTMLIPPDLVAGSVPRALTNVEPGDLVDEEYVAAVAPSGPSRRGHLSPYVYRFADPERAFGLSEYVLLVPDGLPVSTDGRFEGLEYREERAGDLRVLWWRAERVPPVPDEPFAPPTQELLPWVTYGFGVTWGDVGDRLRDRVLPVLASTPELDEFAAPLLAEQDPLAALRDLVGAVCDRVDQGGAVLDLGSTGGQSFSRRRGNRLGVVAAALAAAGWDVELALARPLELAGTHLAVPNDDTFLVPLLRVARGERPIFVDVGEERSGVDHVNPVLQGGDALILPLTRPALPVSYLESIPRFPNPQLEDRLRLEARIQPSGAARLLFTATLRGAQGERTLSRVNGVPQDRVDMVYRQIAAALFPGAEAVHGRVERAGEEVLLSLELDLPGACDLAEDAMTCRGLSLARPLAPTQAPLPERRFPLVIRLPMTQVVDLDVEFPPGWAERRPPRRLVSDFGRVEETRTVDGRRERSTLTIELPAQVVPPESYRDFVRFCHAADELAARPMSLSRDAPPK